MGLRRSFYVAFRGIKSCIQTERNMRIHLTITTFVLLFSIFYNFSKLEYCLIIMAIGSVTSMEVANTSIETVVDMFASSYSTAAKIAKDLAAGAVLVLSISALAVGIMLFWDIPTFILIYEFFLGNIIALIALVLLLIISMMFIFKKNK